MLMMQLKNSIKRGELITTSAQLAALVDTYNQQLAQVSDRIDTMTTQANTLAQQVQKASDDTIVGRREEVQRLVHNAQAEGIKLTQKQLAEQLGVSLTTVRADIKAMNGRVK